MRAAFLSSRRVVVVFDTVSSFLILINFDFHLLQFRKHLVGLVSRGQEARQVVDLMGKRWALYRLTKHSGTTGISISSGLSWSLPIHERVWLWIWRGSFGRCLSKNSSRELRIWVADTVWVSKVNWYLVRLPFGSWGTWTCTWGSRPCYRWQKPLETRRLLFSLSNSVSSLGTGRTPRQT